MMLEMLRIVEKHLLEGDNLLFSDPSAWKSKKIDYTPPFVDRMFRDWTYAGVQYRIYLHRIYACDRAFFHPHPWPSAVRVIGGPGSAYEMGVGFGPSGRHDPPPIASTLMLPSGATYAMEHPDGWHHVRVIGEPSVSLMVSGPVWERDAPRTERHTFRELTLGEKEPLQRAIINYYGRAAGL